MPQVPDHLHPGLVRGPDHGKNTRPIVLAGALFDKMPSDAIARGEDSVFLQPAVIAGGKPVVPRRREHVQTAAVAAHVCGTLEAANKETAK